jgi:hypothetical protein
MYIVQMRCTYSGSEKAKKKEMDIVQPVLFLLLLPTWAWKPLLIAFTDRLEPQDSQAMKKIRFSFVRSVSGDLHVLHVTYSTAEAGNLV